MYRNSSERELLNFRTKKNVHTKNTTRKLRKKKKSFCRAVECKAELVNVDITVYFTVIHFCIIALVVVVHVRRVYICAIMTVSLCLREAHKVQWLVS